VGHNISGVIVKGGVLEAALADYDTSAVELLGDLTLVWMDIHYTEYWRHRLGIPERLPLPTSITDQAADPDDAVIAELIRCVAVTPEAPFAVVWTDYFGGVGDQRAAVYRRTGVIETDGTINGALRALGVSAGPGVDEFDTVGLSKFRHIPDDLLDRWEAYDDA
jgi:hypothetical protein